MDKVNKTYQISTRIYDLIYELNLIYPSLLLQVLPQLECKLKTGSEPDRQSKWLRTNFDGDSKWRPLPPTHPKYN